MNPKKLDILITGGLGFIGSNLAIKLIDEDHKVTIIDSLIDGYGGNIYNLKNFENKCNINISDIRDENSIKYLVKDKDVIFNLAAQIGHQRSMINPIQDAPQFKIYRDPKEVKNAKYVSKNSVHLPSSPNLKKKEIKYICKILNEFFEYL